MELNLCNRKTLRTRYPDSLFSEAIIELTDACNYHCIHCYNDNSHSTISTAAVYEIIDTLKEMGVIYITLTGGEAMLHPNFPKIYTRMKKSGFVVTLFTNGSFILQHKALFRELPPRLFSISVYGIDEEMYHSFTGIPGQFQKLEDSLSWLVTNRQPIDLKVLVTKRNYSLVLNGAYDRYAEKFGLKIRYDFQLMQTEKQSAMIADLALDVSEMHTFLLKRNLLPKKVGNDEATRKPYSCYAGEKVVSVNSRGEYCLCLRDTACSIADSRPAEIQPFLRARKAAVVRKNALRTCASCEHNTVCDGVCSLSDIHPGDTICKLYHLLK